MYTLSANIWTRSKVRSCSFTVRCFRFSGLSDNPGTLMDQMFSRDLWWTPYCCVQSDLRHCYEQLIHCSTIASHPGCSNGVHLPLGTVWLNCHLPLVCGGCLVAYNQVARGCINTLIIHFTILWGEDICLSVTTVSTITLWRSRRGGERVWRVDREDVPLVNWHNRPCRKDNELIFLVPKSILAYMYNWLTMYNSNLWKLRGRQIL